ncbi:universal stress protein [Terracoccus sp. 273MFTsu3.1]|uniref:universal stress protein n=1 Tax=Terracoccus sp. 273MFTsu3.1 TaxID=1172188 RepID=UPI0003720818|nr:universal stress protein [Terracoccus sp. 273MFTsu3.1]
MDETRRRDPGPARSGEARAATRPAEAWGADAARQRGRIIVGVDGSKQSRTALRWACADARATGSTVVAVAVWHLYPLAPPERVGTSPWWFTADPEEATRAFLGEVVDEVADDFPDVVVEQKVLSGHAAEQLISLSAVADLVVLGATGSGGFAGMSLGSTSRAVVEHALSTVVLAR